MYFEKIPKAWQEAMNQMTDVVCGGEHPDVRAAWRETHAKYLSEIVIRRRPSKSDREEMEISSIDFHNGWEAMLEYVGADQKKAIAAWVRAKGEPTDYSDLQDNDYPAFIVKESDVVELEKA
jgi:hypothetical protein